MFSARSMLVVAMLISVAVPAVAQQRVPPLSSEAQQAITMRDFQALAQDYGAEAQARKTAEDSLAAAQATIAQQALKLSWWAKYVGHKAK